MNDGTGQLNYTSDEITFAKFSGQESNSGNYGNVWSDVNGDGLMDYYIAKCRQGVSSVSDGTETSGIDVRGLPIQATMKDFDNDGFVDVFVTGTGGFFYLNNGDKTFTLVRNAELNFTDGENSFACGDLNHDGFLDLMIGYGNGFNGPSSADDKLWINDKNDNHWLAVQLEGVVSNLDGIGSRIEIYGDWGVMVREVRAGESYGISHTLTQHFGIGESTNIDEIIVRWPSGQVDSYQDIIPDQFVKLKEGNCITPPSTLVLDGPTTFCTGDDLTLTAPEGFQYVWSNGATTQSITVNTSGIYNVEILNGSDCNTTSINVNVEVDPEESFDIFAESALVICENESVTIKNDLGESVNWSTGQVAAEVSVSQSGLILWYHYLCSIIY